MPSKTIAAHIARRAHLEKMLQERGVATDLINEIFVDIEEYMNIDDDLEKLRNVQFTRDAYDLLCIDFKNATQRQDRVAVFLRRFAEHIVLSTLDILDIPDAPLPPLHDIVDRIPAMDPEPEEK